MDEAVHTQVRKQMPRKVPTQIVNLIDRYFPWAKDWKLGSKVQEREATRFAAVTWLPGLVENLDQVPDGLVVLEQDEAAEFLMAHAALRQERQILAAGSKDAVDFPMLKQRDCVEIVRTALAKCPDEGPSISATELKFLKDSTLEKTLATDLGSIERALSNGEWKAATVIGGSVIEALLLWALDQRSATDVSSAIAGALTAKKIKSSPDADHSLWKFFELIEVAYQLKEIGDDTLSSANPSRNFRNAIHPGRVQRTGIQCDRGMAHTKYGAVFNVIRELSAKHP
jgi:hypothetical protein